jgi:CheY-like chemotaxis protein
VFKREHLPSRVLIVDDAPHIRQIHTCFLHTSGTEVLTADNGIGALNVARSAVPDVVVTDLDMPVMDGLALCRQLRAEVGHGSQPVREAVL